MCHYIETSTLVALMDVDYRRVDELIDQMLPSERATFVRQLEELATLIRQKEATGR